MATWNYFAPGHGKGAPDGIGGRLKRIADDVVAQRKDIDSFSAFICALKQNTRKILLDTVHEEDILSLAEMIPASIQPFKGTMKIHQVVFSRATPTQLKMNSLSCFSCYDCDKFTVGLLEFTEDKETLYEGTPLQHCTVESSELMNVTEEMQESLPTEIIPGTYLLVKFRGLAKRNIIHTFRYVCCVEELLEDDNIMVIGFKSCGSAKEFVKVDNDESLICKNDILEILPDPSHVIKHRKNVLVFAKPVNIKEQ